ncbi:Hint domain-containing protein [Alisedimentitalea sp. MJ-SS2]|uniref:Hint domain-containing protein n=1 Tax=Aliisedimentitalea sp. MJ-SS2 TaxID=3049795 RepID=UPI00290DE355|nr:Hint domain-containing protein [Alisedimentitalea sp. MJ-SS2]MDU8928985.1 Hint domain-containing protein [Alisedimentitalea sp. MJ-SS2]
MSLTFWARTDSNSANNPALNLTGDPATQITFVASGTNGDLFLEPNGGAPDPDTQIEIGGVLYDFTFELAATLPTLNNDGAQQIPDQFEGSAVIIITVHDYPSAGDTTRLTFMPDETATQAEMDAFGNGAADLQNITLEPAPDYIVEGTSGADTIDANYNGDLEGDRIDNGDGNPLQPGSAGGDNDSVMAGAGADYIASGLGNDSIYGEEGDDTLLGGIGADDLFGGLGNDSFFLAEGDDAYGGEGEDLFILTDLGEAGASTITIDGGTTGEPGGDTLDLNGLGDRTTLTFSPSVGDPDAFDGTITMLDGTVVTFTNIEHIICFTPGTMIATPDGERPVEDLRPGDMILTKDDGPQRLGWTGLSDVSGTGKHAPVTLAPKLTGARRPLTVSPQHRMLISDWRAELFFGDAEVFVPATHMLDFQGAETTPRERVTYIHLMFDRHQVIYAEGAETESFHLADQGLMALHPLVQEEMFTAYPNLRDNLAAHGPTARRCLKAHESATLLSRMFTAKPCEMPLVA